MQPGRIYEPDSTLRAFQAKCSSALKLSERIIEEFTRTLDFPWVLQ
jgi:hypothetical protein